MSRNPFLRTKPWWKGLTGPQRRELVAIERAVRLLSGSGGSAYLPEGYRDCACCSTPTSGDLCTACSARYDYLILRGDRGGFVYKTSDGCRFVHGNWPWQTIDVTPICDTDDEREIVLGWEGMARGQVKGVDYLYRQQWDFAVNRYVITCRTYDVVRKVEADTRMLGLHHTIAAAISITQRMYAARTAGQGVQDV